MENLISKSAGLFPACPVPPVAGLSGERLGDFLAEVAGGTADTFLAKSEPPLIAIPSIFFDPP